MLQGLGAAYLGDYRVSKDGTAKLRSLDCRLIHRLRGLHESCYEVEFIGRGGGYLNFIKVSPG